MSLSSEGYQKYVNSETVRAQRNEDIFWLVLLISRLEFERKVDIQAAKLGLSMAADTSIHVLVSSYPNHHFLFVF